MCAETRPLNKPPTLLQGAAFSIGLLVLIATWAVLYGWISLGTEALLVPWNCECTWDTRPVPGSFQRTVNDFFDTSGAELPSLVFVLISAVIFAFRALRSSDRAWLPWIFSLANLFFFLASLAGTSLAWAASNWMVGPRLSGIDAGFHRNWYVIVGHAILWIVLWAVLVRLPSGRRTDTRRLTAARQAN